MKCLTYDCEDEAVARGLCHSCYQSAVYRIRNKRTSWTELIAMGLAAQATQGGGRICKFQRSLEKARVEITEEDINDL